MQHRLLLRGPMHWSISVQENADGSHFDNSYSSDFTDIRSGTGIPLLKEEEVRQTSEKQDKKELGVRPRPEKTQQRKPCHKLN